MSDLIDFEGISKRTVRDLATQQDKWILAQAKLRGVTAEELAKDYYIEWEPVELSLGTGGSEHIYKAMQRCWLRRRDGGNSGFGESATLADTPKDGQSDES